jgi:hypothetical protein
MKSTVFLTEGFVGKGRSWTCRGFGLILRPLVQAVRPELPGDVLREILEIVGDPGFERRSLAGSSLLKIEPAVRPLRNLGKLEW